MRRVLPFVLALAACPTSSAPPPVTGPHALDARERESLGAPATLFDLLPDGPATKVLLRTNGSQEPVGFSFPVRADVAPFTVHAMRRELARAASAADGGSPAAAPLVYESSLERDGRRRIAVRTKPLGGDDGAILDDAGLTALDTGRLSDFLDRWRDETGLSVLGATADWVILELDRLPKDEQAFLADLDAFTGQATDDEGDVLARPLDDLRAELVSTHRVALP